MTLDLTPAQLRVVWNALAQFVENGNEDLECSGLTPVAHAELETAESLLERLDAHMARPADDTDLLLESMNRGFAKMMKDPDPEDLLPGEDPRPCNVTMPWELPPDLRAHLAIGLLRAGRPPQGR